LLGTVAQTCNTSHLGGGDWVEIAVQGQAKQKVCESSYQSMVACACYTSYAGLEAHDPGRPGHKVRPISKRANKKGWWSGWGDRVPAYQAKGLEFNPQLDYLYILSNGKTLKKIWGKSDCMKIRTLVISS
jgi:hypothetical protein